MGFPNPPLLTEVKAETQLGDFDGVALARTAKLVSELARKGIDQEVEERLESQILPKREKMYKRL